MPVPKYSFYITKATIPSGSGRLWFDKNDTQLAQSNLTSCYCHNNKFTLAENVFVVLCLKNVVWIMLHVQFSFEWFFDLITLLQESPKYFIFFLKCCVVVTLFILSKPKTFAFWALLSILCTIVQFYFPSDSFIWLVCFNNFPKRFCFLKKATVTKKTFDLLTIRISF